MQEDIAYLSKYNSIFTCYEASGRNWNNIPSEYMKYFVHEFADGDISLLPAADKLQNTEDLEEWQLGELIELLAKVDPNHWPDVESIEAIDSEQFISESSEEPEKLFDFLEDNLGVSDKVQRVLKEVLGSVFKAEIDSIRSKKKEFPSPKNNFLQEADGTFSGIFNWSNHEFEFEVAPTEAGWLCTYRMTEKCLNKLQRPQFNHPEKEKKSLEKKIRNQSWR